MEKAILRKASKLFNRYIASYSSNKNKTDVKNTILYTIAIYSVSLIKYKESSSFLSGSTLKRMVYLIENLSELRKATNYGEKNDSIIKYQTYTQLQNIHSQANVFLEDKTRYGDDLEAFDDHIDEISKVKTYASQLYKGYCYLLLNSNYLYVASDIENELDEIFYKLISELYIEFQLNYIPREVINSKSKDKYAYLKKTYLNNSFNVQFSNVLNKSENSIFILLNKFLIDYMNNRKNVNLALINENYNVVKSSYELQINKLATLTTIVENIDLSESKKFIDFINFNILYNSKLSQKDKTELLNEHKLDLENNRFFRYLNKSNGFLRFLKIPSEKAMVEKMFSKLDSNSKLNKSMLQAYECARKYYNYPYINSFGIKLSNEFIKHLIQIDNLFCLVMKYNIEKIKVCLFSSPSELIVLEKLNESFDDFLAHLENYKKRLIKYGFFHYGAISNNEIMLQFGFGNEFDK